jgi:XTP/dITP diphosphohydrolase
VKQPAAAGSLVVLATTNPGKLVEITAILAGLPLVLRGLDAFPGLILPKEGHDYEANAIAKAQTAARGSARPALADDSGLEVEALGGAPGPHSARFGGPGLSDAQRVERLLSELVGVPPERRGARFVCLAALAVPDGGVVTARGECRGRILSAPRGSGGFGYDPVFEVSARGCSMAELPLDEKNRISHRAGAFRGLVGALRAELGRR